MIPGTANPTATLRGDYWDGWQSISINDPGVCPVRTLTSAKMEFRGADNQVEKTLSTEDGTITIGTAIGTAWVLTVPGLTWDIAAGSYNFDLQTIDDLSKKRTYWRGILTLQQDITI